MKLNQYSLILIAVFQLFGSSIIAQQNTLWYNKPAKVWEEALPLGNSRIGAMVYGNPVRDEIQLNEETIWGGGPCRNDNPNALNVLPQVRQLIFDGKNKDAEGLINSNFVTRVHGMPFQTAGSVILNFPGHDAYSGLYRELDINRAVATTTYTLNGVKYTREAFSSFADDVFIMKISANKKAVLTFDLSYSSPVKNIVKSVGSCLVLEGQGSNHEGIEGVIRYQTHTTIKNDGGSVVYSDSKISVNNATSVIIYVSIATNFVDYKTVNADPQKKATDKLNAALKHNYKSAIKTHSTIYANQFKRLKLNIGSAEDSKLPTNERILNYSKSHDPSLVSLLFQYGRYLLICSSQPGGQPANLQGIWANQLVPPWDSKYTININTEMNYWPAEVTNLSETHSPLFQMIKDLSVTGQETAQKMYGAKGWVAHHNTDIWRITGVVDGAYWGMWPNGGAWLCRHLWEHYLYTGDKKFLAEIYPVMKGSADFFLSFLVKDPQNGWMVTAPSVSPEHGPFGTSVTAGCTMDNQIAYDILMNTFTANEILNEDKGYREQLKTMALKLPPMQIGKHTQLQEWIQDLDDPKNDHRHISHLYGLFPSNQISPYTNPQLFEAARNTLVFRGDMATGWSIGWKVNFWARLLDGNHAYSIVNNMLTLTSKESPNGRTYPNMFTAHPPFQIDGNFGLTAGVAEMLLQSHDGAVHILPALPDAWSKGSVSGLVARGGFEVTMDWSDGKINALIVKSKIGGNLRIRSYEPLKGAGLRKAEGENANQLLAPVQVVSPLVSDKAQFKGVNLKQIYEYDIQTMAGKNYKFSKL